MLNGFLVVYAVGATLASVAGAVMIIVGVAVPVRRLEPDPAAPRISLVRGATGTPLGASLVGSF